MITVLIHCFTIVCFTGRVDLDIRQQEIYFSYIWYCQWRIFLFICPLSLQFGLLLGLLYSPVSQTTRETSLELPSSSAPRSHWSFCCSAVLHTIQISRTVTSKTITEECQSRSSLNFFYDGMRRCLRRTNSEERENYDHNTSAITMPIITVAGSEGRESRR